MLRSASRMRGYKIAAVDGIIGKVADWYFEDRSWAVRYLVADMGGWLPGRRVLLSPSALGDADEDAGSIPVGLSSEQVRKSPASYTDEPVSRQHEIALQQHFGWPAYWTAGLGMAAPVEPAPISGAGAGTARASGDPGLRSLKEVTGYTIHATDGEIGRAEDFIVDDEEWLLRYVLVDTGSWLPGEHVIVATSWVGGVSWAERTVFLNLTQEAIRNSPPFDASQPVNREYEAKLYEYYQGIRESGANS